MPAAIHCRDLHKTYDGKPLEAVSAASVWRSPPANVFSLAMAPNGAGKTTTIEILEGLLAPTSGEVTILGHTWQQNPRQLREWLGISLQETRLSEKLTVRETVALFSSFYRESRAPPMMSWRNCSSPKKPTPGLENSQADSASGLPWRPRW